MSDALSDDGEGSATASASTNAVTRLAAVARRDDAQAAARICRELNIYATAPRTEKDKSYVWRSILTYKSNDEEKKGFYCMASDCKKWKKGNSSQASDHLRTSHPDEWARVKRLKNGEDNDTVSSSSVFNKVQTKLHHHQYWRGDALQRAHKYLAGFLVRSLRPFNLVNDQGFKDFMSAIAPQYKLPTTRTISKYMGAMFVKAKGDVKGFLAPLASDEGGGAECGLTICLQTDAWAARNGRSYNGTLANTLDDDFRPRLICLDMVECQKKHHTAPVITGLLTKTMQDNEIPPFSVFRTVHDSGSNVKKGVWVCVHMGVFVCVCACVYFFNNIGDVFSIYSYGGGICIFFLFLHTHTHVYKCYSRARRQSQVLALYHTCLAADHHKLAKRCP